MATTLTNKIAVTELDFDLIKSTLKAYLRGQDQFTDYDFEDSGLSVLLDVLAYNTHYTGFYTNMIANEMFLDSAAIRNSIVSRAKQLSYIPKSPQGAIAVVDVTFTINETSPANLPANVNIPKGHIFTTTIENKSYTFLVTSSATASPTQSIPETGPVTITYKASSVSVKEGVATSVQYIIGTEGTDQKFIIPNTDADMTTLEVTVTDTITGTSETKYTKVTDTTSISSTDTGYWLQEGFDQKFEIYFGDGQVGKQPDPGNIVTLEYSLTKEDLGNGASIFECDPIPTADGLLTYPRSGTSDGAITTETLSSASGGAERETTSSIKFLAPLNYESQNRAVTSNDYKTKLVTDYANIDAIRVWGGEDNDPPNYGAVYIAIKPKTGFVLTNTEKNSIIETIVSPNNVVTIRPVIVDPEYIFLEISIIVKYNSLRTNITPSSLAKLISLTVSDFNDQNLEKFESYFRYSSLLQTIDGAEASITNSLLTIKMRINLAIAGAGNYTIKFANPIFHPHSTHQGSVTSTRFTYFENLNCVLEDLNGVMRVISNTGEILNANIGTVNYDNGTISLVGFNPTVSLGGIIGISVLPRYNDIVSGVTQLIVINDSDVSVQLVDDSSTQSTLLDPQYIGSST